MIQVISLTGTLSYTGKYRISAVLCRYVTDQLLNQNGLTNTGTAEQTNLSTLLVRAEKINDLDTCLQQLRVG